MQKNFEFVNDVEVGFQGEVLDLHNNFYTQEILLDVHGGKVTWLLFEAEPNYDQPEITPTGRKLQFVFEDVTHVTITNGMAAVRKEEKLVYTTGYKEPGDMNMDGLCPSGSEDEDDHFVVGFRTGDFLRVAAKTLVLEFV